MNWYAVQTQYRHEKAVADQLCGKGMDAFLPLHKSRRQWSDRKVTVRLPLFPTYLFVRADLQEHHVPILHTQGVVRLLGTGSEPQAVPSQQIEAVKRLVFSKLPYDPYPYVVSGDRVRIVRGHLKGLEGVLLEKKSRCRFVLSVDLLSQGASLEIDAEDVEKVRKAA